jgi:DNA-binding MarR family transcriptional regulator
VLAFDPVQRAFELWRERWGESSSMRAITSLMRAHQLVLAQVDAIVKPYGLTFARYEALVLLVFSSRGSLPLSKIGERLQVHPTSVTNIIDRLEKSGLVARKPNPLDGRGTLAEITPRGREVVEQATADLMAADFGLSVLSTGQHDTLFDTLRVLRLGAGDFEDTESVESIEGTDGAGDPTNRTEPAGPAEAGR